MTSEVAIRAPDVFRRRAGIRGTCATVLHDGEGEFQVRILQSPVMPPTPRRCSPVGLGSACLGHDQGTGSLPWKATGIRGHSVSPQKNVCRRQIGPRRSCRSPGVTPSCRRTQMGTVRTRRPPAKSSCALRAPASTPPSFGGLPSLDAVHSRGRNSEK